MVNPLINAVRKKLGTDKMSISSKISLSFIILWTILILIVIIVIRTIYSMMMFAQFKERIEYTGSLVSQQVEKFTENINDCSNSLIISFNAKFGHNLKSKVFPDSEDISTNRSILNNMTNTLLMFSEAEKVSVVFKNNTVYSLNGKNLSSSVSSDSEVFSFMKTLNIDTDGMWYYSSRKILDSTFCYLKALRNIDANETIGYIVIKINEDNLLKLYENDKSSKYTSFYICNREGAILSSSVRNLTGTDITDTDFLRKIDLSDKNRTYSGNISNLKKKYFYKLTILNNTGWRFLSLVDYDAVAGSTNLMTVIILLVSFCVLVVFYWIIITISKSISRPIKKLAKHMLQFQNTLPQAIEQNHSNYEIGVLTSNFNTMIQKNSELFERFNEENRKKRHFELALMQAQIKPHFLYNTLDTAYCLIGINKSEEAKRTIKLLVDYYRLVLNKGIEWISLEKELICTSKYMEIQKIRHNDIFNYEMDISEDIMQLKVPKLTIQPLIENAIYHGIKPKNTRGNIRITGEMQGNWVYIRVIDDGVGISKEKFDSLLSDEHTTGESDSFGLKNISERLRLFYGEESKLCLETNEHNETIMAICIFLGNEEVE